MCSLRFTVMIPPSPLRVHISLTRQRHNISLSLLRSHRLSLAQCKTKSNQVRGCPRSLSYKYFDLCRVPLVTSIIVTHKTKLLAQTCIMRRQKKHIAEGDLYEVSLSVSACRHKLSLRNTSHTQAEAQ